METTDCIDWTKDWLVQAPTCDVPVFDLSESTHHWIRTSFQEVLFPLLYQVIAPELDIRPEDLRVQDCFIVLYDYGEKDERSHTSTPGFESFKPHQDESLIPLTIALNDMDTDYEGGGDVYS